MDSNDKNIQAIISEFLTQYDISDLTQALQHYTDMNQEYIVIEIHLNIYQIL